MQDLKQPNYFKSALISNFKILVIIVFIVNLYVFSLPIEFILVPFLVMLGALTAIAEIDEQYVKICNKRLFSDKTLFDCDFTKPSEPSGEPQKEPSNDNNKK